MKLYFASIIIFSFGLFSCTEEKSKEPKSPTLYGAEFCECLVKNNLNDQECMHIIEAVKKTHGEENKEAEMEFKTAVKKCVRNKTFQKANQNK